MSVSLLRLELPAAAANDSERLKAELMRVVHDHATLSDCDEYAAGSPALLAVAQELLLAKGLPHDQLVLDYPR